MARVTIILEDTADGVDISVEADPPFPMKKPEEATLAHRIGLSLVEGARQASDEISTPGD